MSLEEAKAGVATSLCLRFVNLHEATRRRDLVVKFKKPQILSEMEQQSLCRSQDNQKLYFPTVGSFALIPDADLLEQARLGTVRTIHVLKDLFEVYEREEPYTLDDVEAHARKIYDHTLDTKIMRLGLYLSADLGALGSYGRSGDGLDIKSFTIPEHILSFESPEDVWDARIEGARKQAKGDPFAQLQLDPRSVSARNNAPAIEGTKDWYFQESLRMAQKTPRCPFATPDLCPRYYQSLSLSGELGATEMDSHDASRLKAKWDNAPPFAVLREQLPSVQGGDREFSSLDNFCPEVTYDIRGVFASMIGRYVDEIDRDMAHRRLSKQNAPIEDPSWSWGFIVPLHYTSCPTFSVLAGKQSGIHGSQHELLDALLGLPGVDRQYVSQQVERLDTKDTALAIGTAKEVLETCCKTILKNLGGSEVSSPKVTVLVKATVQALQNSDRLTKASSDSTKTMLNALGTLVTGIAELRNAHGTGHGKTEGSSEIGVPQARLAIGAASALCIYFTNCLRDGPPLSSAIDH